VFLFFAVIAAALAIAVLIGGDVRRLSQLRLRHLELLLAAFAVKISVGLLGTTHAQAAINAARPLNAIGAVLLLAVVWFNRRIPGAILFGAGLTLNLIVILAFGGRIRCTWRCSSPRVSGSSAMFLPSPASPDTPRWSASATS